MGKLEIPGRPWYLRPRSIQQIMAAVAFGGLVLVTARPQPQGLVYNPLWTTAGPRVLVAPGNLYDNAGIDPRFVRSAPTGIDDRIIIAAPARIDDNIVAPR